MLLLSPFHIYFFLLLLVNTNKERIKDGLLKFNTASFGETGMREARTNEQPCGRGPLLSAPVRS